MIDLLDAGDPAVGPGIFDEISLRSVRVRNRVWMSPMCQYSADAGGRLAGQPADWHLTHLAARAQGGAGLVMVEATAVSPEGRITPQDLGIWSDEHITPLRRLAEVIRAAGAVPAIQLSHAGEKGSVDLPWKARGRRLSVNEGGWVPLGPVHDPAALTSQLSLDQVGDVVTQFGAAAQRAAEAGFEAVEIHGAHGYLIHQFLSPYKNTRTDAYGGGFDERKRFALEVFREVRRSFPEELPVMFRLSATDWWGPGSDAWDVSQATRLAAELDGLGVDFLDVTSGGLVKGARIDVYPGYQVPFANTIRRIVDVAAVGAVGKITAPLHAEAIVRSGAADVVMLGRALLEDPFWPRKAAMELGGRLPFPPQYEWAIGPRGNSDFGSNK